jgi:formate-dependent nitrite reductase membrane component NrfD
MTTQTINIDRFLRSRHIRIQHEWGWQVVADLFLAGTGAGSLVFAILMDWLGFVGEDIRPFIMWGPLFVAAGAMFLVLKLGVKIRFLNTILNPMSSWLSRGFYILSGCIVSGGLLLVASLIPVLGIDTWLGITMTDFSWIITTLNIICFVFAIGSALYTGILILSVKYVPLWYTLLLPTLFTVSALASGSMLVIMSAQVFDIFFNDAADTAAMITILVYANLVLVFLEAFALYGYLRSRYAVSEFGRYSVQLMTQGKLKLMFRGGVILCGFILPVMLIIAYLVLQNIYLLLGAGALMLLGRFFLRWVIIYSGLKDLPPMLRMVEKRLRLERETAGDEPVRENGV